MKPRWIRYLVRGVFFVLTAILLPIFPGVLSWLVFVGVNLIVPHFILECRAEYDLSAVPESEQKRQYEFLSTLDDEGKRRLGARITMYADALGASDRTIATYSRNLSSRTVFSYMLGNWTDFDLSDIYSIASVLNVPPCELLFPDNK